MTETETESLFENCMKSCSRKRDGRNGPRRALEQHPAAAAGPFCAHDVVVFQVGDHATPACLLLFLHRSNRERAILLK